MNLNKLKIETTFWGNIMKQTFTYKEIQETRRYDLTTVLKQNGYNDLSEFANKKSIVVSVGNTTKKDIMGDLRFIRILYKIFGRAATERAFDRLYQEKGKMYSFKE